MGFRYFRRRGDGPWIELARRAWLASRRQVVSGFRAEPSVTWHEEPWAFLKWTPRRP